MVNLATHQAMQRQLEENLPQYVREHPGEFVLFEGNWAKIETTFYKTKGELEKALEKYKGKYGPTTLSREIPQGSMS